MRAAWQQLDVGWRLALWLLFTMRLGFGLITLLSAEFQKPIYYQAKAYLLLHGPTPWIYILSSWQRWDARWYQEITEYGYSAGTGSDAFFPLYPLLTRVVSFFAFGHNPGGHVVWAQLLVSSTAFLVGMGLLYKLARLDVGPATAQLAVLLLALFPTGLFLLAPYTESLYLALSVGAFYLARREHPWAAGIVGFAAGLTRMQGVFLAPALAFEYIQQRRRHGKWPGWGLLAAALPVAALVLFNVYLHAVVGETRSALQIQAEWGYTLTSPWTAISASWNDITHSSDLVEALNLFSLIGFAVLTLWMVRSRLPLSYTIYAVPYLALLYARLMYFSPLMSLSRFTLVLFPCFIVLAMRLARRPWLAASWLVVGALFQVGLLEVYVQWGFVG
jgi:Mannosyltransferase (PIG-V)